MGTTTVYWEQEEGTKTNIWYEHYQNGTWGEPQLVVSGSDNNTTSLRDVITTPHGDIVLFWSTIDVELAANHWATTYSNNQWNTLLLGTTHYRTPTENVWQTDFRFYQDFTNNSFSIMLREQDPSTDTVTFMATDYR